MKVQTRHSLLLWGLVAVLPLTDAFAAPAPFRVVLDPGHGGPDPGTLYDGGMIQISEKDVTLAIAKQTAIELKALGIETTLTREEDQELALPDRTALANRLKADLFVSIHMNSIPTTPGEESRAHLAEGIETYILNSTSDESSRRLAHLENAGLNVLPEDSAPGKDIALILKDLQLDANLSESKHLACAVQDQLVKSTSRTAALKKLRDRGVKQALFYVLLGANMPSILVEAGFLAHSRDRKWVLSAAGQQTIGGSIARGIEEFRKARGTPLAQATLSSCQVH